MYNIFGNEDNTTATNNEPTKLTTGSSIHRRTCGGNYTGFGHPSHQSTQRQLAHVDKPNGSDVIH
jgi:hypothetical protein